MIGEDGNIFNLLAICKRTLKRHPGAFIELQNRVISSLSYDEALNIIMEYIEIE